MTDDPRHATDAGRTPPPRLRRAGRGIVVGAALASLALHASAAWGLRGRREARTPSERVVASAGEFIELPPVAAEPPPEPEPREPEPREPEPAPTAAEAMPELPDTPTGLRVRRPAAMARLALSSYGEGAGPFGLRDRLTIGQYTPRMSGSAPARTPPTHVATADEAPVGDEAASPENTTPPSEPTEPAADPAESSATTDPEAEEIVAIEIDDPADTPRIRPPSVIEESSSLELATLPGSPLTEPLLEQLASASIRAELGLDDVSLLRVTRSRPRGSRSVALAFVTTLTPDELRLRVAAALRGRDVTSEFAERDGTWSMTTLIGGEPHTLVIDGHVIVLAELGAGAAAVTGRILVDARADARTVWAPGDADPNPERPVVTARFPPSSHEPMLSVSTIEVRLFAPSPASPSGRLVASFTSRPPPPRAVVDEAPAAGATEPTTAPDPSADASATHWSAIVERELLLAPGSLEMIGAPRATGAVVEADMSVLGTDFTELASRVLRRR